MAYWANTFHATCQVRTPTIVFACCAASSQFIWAWAIGRQTWPDACFHSAFPLRRAKTFCFQYSFIFHSRTLLMGASAGPLEIGSFFWRHLVHSRRLTSSQFSPFRLCLSGYMLLFAWCFFVLLGWPGITLWLLPSSMVLFSIEEFSPDCYDFY